MDGHENMSCPKRKPPVPVVAALNKDTKHLAFKEVRQLVKGQKFDVKRRIQSINFTLSPYYVKKVLSRKQADGTFPYEVQLNIWNYGTTEKWEDIHLDIKVNRTLIHVANPKYPCPHLIYVTPHCSLRAFAQNTITILCPNPETLNDYAFSVSLVERISPTGIILNNPINEVCPRGTVRRVANFIQGLGQYELFLTCPVTESIMEYPCRSIICTHPEVFDLKTFLHDAQFYYKWICPICFETIKYDDIVMDVFLKRKVDEGTSTIVFYKPCQNVILAEDMRCEYEMIQD